LLTLFIWVRWMFPRFRYDQLMDLGWRRFIPLALVNILITAVIMWMRS
jgi:NADH-quinone oxidoreductase subunit H